MANVLESLVVELGIEPSALNDGLERASKALQTFGGRIEAEGGSIDQMAASFTKGGLVMGGVSDDVARKVLEIGTASQKTALITGRAFDRMQKAMGPIGALLAKVVAPFAAAFAGGQILGNLSSLGESLSVLSDRTGVSVNTIDAWAKANRDAGGSAEAFKSALENWTIEQGRAADDFFRLGESVKGMTTEQSAFFLRSMGLSQDAAAVFTQFKDDAAQVAETYRSAAFTKEQAETARQMNILWRRFTDQAQSLGNILAVAVLPVVNKVLSALGQGMAFINQHSRALKIILAGVAAVIGGAYLKGILASIGGIGKLLALMKSGTGIAAAFNAVLMANPLGAVVTAVIALGLALDDLIAFLNGGNSAFAAFLHWIGLSDDHIIEFRKNLNSFIDAVAGFPEYLAGRLAAAWDEIGSIGKSLAGVFDLSGIEGGVRTALSGVPTLASEYLLKPFISSLTSIIRGIDAVAETLGNLPMIVAKGLPRAVESAGKFAQEIGGAIVEGFSSAIDWTANALQGLAKSIARWFADAFDISGTVKEKVGGAVSAVKSWFGIDEERAHESAKKPEAPAHSQQKAPDAGVQWLQKTIPMAQMEAVAPGVASAKQAFGSDKGGITNDMNVTVHNNITTSADPTEVATAVTGGVNNALAKSRRMLVNAQTGVVQKG